jgi:hypothetical protein
MKIKDPVLVSKTVNAVYIVDVEGKKIEVTYWYNADEEGKGGWDWDLNPCYIGLTEQEIEDLDEEFEAVLEDIGL